MTDLGTQVFLLISKLYNTMHSTVLGIILHLYTSLKHRYNINLYTRTLCRTHPRSFVRESNSSIPVTFQCGQGLLAQLKLPTHKVTGIIATQERLKASKRHIKLDVLQFWVIRPMTTVVFYPESRAEDVQLT